jgi:hypothetical protein
MREPAWAAGVVTSCTEANLRAAMSGGGTVTFACDGTIPLLNFPPNRHPYPISVTSNTMLDGTGHHITISGTNTVEGIFYVNNNVTLVLVNLTLANGFSTNGGGAICIQSGTVCATNCIFTGNTAMPSTNFFGQLLNDAQGGAILNEGGYVNLQNCQFRSNSAAPVLIYNGIYIGVGNVAGGAIFNTGTLIMDNCQLVQNSAGAGLGIGADGGWAYGGAIYNSGNAVIDRSSFISNSAAGGDGYPEIYYGMPGGNGSAAWGGAIYNLGNAVISRSSFISNSVWGGFGGNGGQGHHLGDPGGDGGNGGDAYGSAIYSGGTFLLQNSTVAANRTSAGDGGMGGSSLGGPHGAVGKGGSAYGAMCGAYLVNVTVTLNSARGGYSAVGGSAFGGIFGCSLTNCTVASNSASVGSGSGSVAIGGGTMGSLANTLLAGNMPSNCPGYAFDGGHNLSTDTSCAFTNVGSMNNTDPKLGPLADNGGPTLTMALLSGSPAIDAGSAIGAPATDQRGIYRPQGAGVDIGAFEYQYSPVITSATIQCATNRQLQLAGVTSNLTVTLQVSTNLLNWWDATNFLAGSNGVFQCVDPIPGDTQSRFYRLKSGTP